MLFGFRRLVYLCRQYRRHRQAKNQLQDNGKKLNQADDVIPDKAGESGSDRKSTRLNSSHTVISYAVFCLKKKKKKQIQILATYSSM